VSSIIRDRPVTSFLLIAFGVSYVLGLPFNIIVSSILNPSSLVGFYLPRVVTVAGPAVAALLVARAGGGVVSVAQLLGSLRLQAGDVWWVASAAAGGLLIAGAAFVLAGLPPEKLLELASTRAPLLFGHALVHVAVIGVGEELGWRGWLLPSLSARRSFIAATFLTGLVWAVWHLPLLLSGLSIALSFTALLASLSIVFSWLWYRTAGSTGLVALAHGFVNAPFFFLEQLVRPLPDGGTLTVRAFGCFAGCYGVVAVALAVHGRDFWRARGVTFGRVEARGTE
jgi:membrane protease YdiL (CAAX protease family)